MLLRKHLIDWKFFNRYNNIFTIFFTTKLPSQLFSILSSMRTSSRRITKIPNTIFENLNEILTAQSVFQLFIKSMSKSYIYHFRLWANQYTDKNWHWNCVYHRVMMMMIMYTRDWLVLFLILSSAIQCLLLIVWHFFFIFVFCAIRLHRGVLVTYLRDCM